MLYCKWCQPKKLVEAVAIIPKPATSRKSPIPICGMHRNWAINHCWHVTNLSGTAINRELEDEIINRKHLRLRGTNELKFKPNEYRSLNGEL